MGCKSTEEMEFMQESNQVQAETGKTMQEAMEIVRERRKGTLEQEKTFFFAVARAVKERESTAKCSCGGTIYITKSKTNSHIHARCDKCRSEMIE